MPPEVTIFPIPGLPARGQKIDGAHFAELVCDIGLMARVLET